MSTSTRPQRPVPSLRAYSAHALGQALSVASRTPLTMVLLASVLVAGTVTGTVARDAFPELMRRFGWDLMALREGRLYSLYVSLLFASLPGLRPTMLIILVLGVWTLEYRCGTLVATAGFFLLGPLVAILTLLLLWPLDVMGVAYVRPVLYTPDMGSSSVALVCWGMAVSKISGWWRAFFLVGTVLPLVLLLAFVPKAYALDHLLAFPAGFILGIWLLRQKALAGRTGAVKRGG